MEHFVVIGGAGYVGTELTSHLLSGGNFVTVVDNFLYGHSHTILPFLGHQRFQFIYGDIRSAPEFMDSLTDITNVVILAGLVGDPVTKKYPELSKDINDGGVVRLIDCLAGRGIQKVIFVSTCSNYGLIPEGQLADENFELNPLSLYAESKVAAELYLLGKNETVDYSPVILRFATAFGLSARMRFDLTVSEFARQLLLGRPLSVYDADTWRPYCHIKDFSRLIEIVANARSEIVSGEVFNAGGSKNNYTKRGIINLIREHHTCGEVSYCDNGSDPRNYKVDFSKVKRILNFEPYYSVKDGIDELHLAILNHVFDDVDARPNFYGNYAIGNSR